MNKMNKVNVNKIDLPKMNLQLLASEEVGNQIEGNETVQNVYNDEGTAEQNTSMNDAELNKLIETKAKEMAKEMATKSIVK